MAYLRRKKYGRSSEQLEHAQLELVGGQLAQRVVMPSMPAEGADGQQPDTDVTSIELARKKPQARERTGVRDLPEHLPRRTVVHMPHSGCDCEACGRGLREIGQDVSVVLDYEPGTFHVVRHVRARWHMHFIPTYSSWLNQVERFFALITDKAIRRDSFTSVKQLVQRIDQFVAHHNTNCQPFRWTATADSILEKLHRLCSRISGTGH